MTNKKANPSNRKPASPRQPTPSVGDRRAHEKLMQDLQRMLNQQAFSSVEEANQFMQQLLASSGGRVPEMPARSALEQAQELMYRAWDSPNRTLRVRLARQALALSLDCADAYVLLAEETARTPTEARGFYEQGVQAGEHALGTEAFQEMEGHFWGALETRPYMRARLGLAQVLWALGEHQSAAQHLRAMLRLNPGDNQGVRYLLATLLLEIDDREALEKLLAQYPDEWSANWKYSSALLAFRQAGKSDESNALLQAALDYNRFVPAYLIGRKRPPKQMPSFISPGEDSEALEYVLDAMLSWQQTDGARDWLIEILTQGKT